MLAVFRFIKNSPLSFQNTMTSSIGLSDFLKMVITVMKLSFKVARVVNLKLVFTD